MLEDLKDRMADIENYILASEERKKSAFSLNENNRQFGCVKS